jgi:predicted HicB family RNase H-like nuclease
MSIPKKRKNKKKVEDTQDSIADASPVEPKEIVTTIRLKADFAAQIDAAAKNLNLSRNSWIRYAISKELEHSE